MASPGRWVTWMKLTPNSRCRRFNSSRILARKKGSNAKSVSSSSSTRGLVINALLLAVGELRGKPLRQMRKLHQVDEFAGT